MVSLNYLCAAPLTAINLCSQALKSRQGIAVTLLKLGSHGDERKVAISRPLAQARHECLEPMNSVA
jgi:hypothetical protein